MILIKPSLIDSFCKVIFDFMLTSRVLSRPSLTLHIYSRNLILYARTPYSRAATCNNQTWRRPGSEKINDPVHNPIGPNPISTSALGTQF